MPETARAPAAIRTIATQQEGVLHGILGLGRVAEQQSGHPVGAVKRGARRLHERRASVRVGVGPGGVGESGVHWQRQQSHVASPDER